MLKDDCPLMPLLSEALLSLLLWTSRARPASRRFL
jgi:hypothetical protein